MHFSNATGIVHHLSTSNTKTKKWNSNEKADRYESYNGAIYDSDINHNPETTKRTTELHVKDKGQVNGKKQKVYGQRETMFEMDQMAGKVKRI